MNALNRLAARKLGVFAASAALVSLVAACGSPEDGGVEGPSVDAGSNVDGSLDNDLGQQDIGALDSGPEDTGPADTGPEDTGPVDTGPEDTGPVDTGPVDTGPVDSGPEDTGPPKPTQEQICKDYGSKFTTVATAARKCTTPFSCTELAPAGVGCKGCEVFYSHDDMAKVQAVHDVSSESTQKKCDPSCPKGCADGTKNVGVCANDGLCSFDTPSCTQLEDRFKAVVAEAHKCSSDGDCKFQAQAALPCGCGAYMNIKTMGPGKPLFRYAKMLVTVYNAKKCFDGACQCPLFKGAKCTAGKCVSFE